MKPATKEQVMAINATLNKLGMMDDKKAIVRELTAGRTESSRELSFDEAKKLLQSLLTGQAPQPQAKNKMISKIFAMAHEMGWVVKKTVVKKGGGLETVNDYSRVYDWIKKYGYLKKDLKDYQYREIPKLLSQFEIGPYKHYLSSL